MKQISSAAHIYGVKFVSAESFTTWRRWNDSPFELKRLADRAQRDLLLGDLRTFVTLRMRTQFDRQALERIRQALQIALERVEIEQQAGRVDFGQRHADRGGRTKTHLAATL